MLMNTPGWPTLSSSYYDVYSEIMARKKRPYKKRRRALSEEETRRRITEAAVQLHGSIGPAKTTVTDLAKEAGVSRMTVYNHFPTEADVFKACSSHWFAQNPFPDISSWSEIDDAEERLRTGLHVLYRWYSEKRGMLGNVFRDARIVPAVADLMEGFWRSLMDEVVTVLTRGWAVPRDEEKRLCATVALTTGFECWKALTEQSLSVDRAADVAADLVIGAVRLRAD